MALEGHTASEDRSDNANIGIMEEDPFATLCHEIWPQLFPGTTP